MRTELFLAAVLTVSCAFAQAQPEPQVDTSEAKRIEAAGGMVQHMGDGVRAGEADLFLEAMELLPPDDSNKFFLSVVSSKSCAPCEKLKAAFRSDEWLQSLACPQDSKKSWAFYRELDKDAAEIKKLNYKVTAYPTVILQLPRSGKYGPEGRIVFQRSGYDGTDKDAGQQLAREIGMALRQYLAKRNDPVESDGVAKRPQHPTFQEDPPSAVPFPVAPEPAPAPEPVPEPAPEPLRIPPLPPEPSPPAPSPVTPVTPPVPNPDEEDDVEGDVTEIVVVTDGADLTPAQEAEVEAFVAEARRQHPRHRVQRRSDKATRKQHDLQKDDLPAVVLKRRNRNPDVVKHPFLRLFVSGLLGRLGSFLQGLVPHWDGFFPHLGEVLRWLFLIGLGIGGVIAYRSTKTTSNGSAPSSGVKITWTPTTPVSASPTTPASGPPPESASPPTG